MGKSSSTFSFSKASNCDEWIILVDIAIDVGRRFSEKFLKKYKRLTPRISDTLL